MFSFHKPKVYRSSAGCCICKAKSSSSRFTDSKKYETDFVECFQLTVPRRGEICNACVLLVKRFKRLPPGSDRHWGHVVDARIGPGLKSITKFKRKKDNCSLDSNPAKPTLFFTQKIRKIFGGSMDIERQHAMNDGSSDEGSLPEFYGDIDKYYEERSDVSRYTYDKLLNRSMRKSKFPKKYSVVQPCVSPIDRELWVEKQSCCGLVYESSIYNAVIIDAESYNPCAYHKFCQFRQPSTELGEARDCRKNILVLQQRTTSSVTKSNKILHPTFIPSNGISNDSVLQYSIPIKQLNLFCTTHERISPPHQENNSNPKLSQQEPIIGKKVWLENKCTQNIACEIKPPNIHRTPILIKNLVRICTDKSHKQKSDVGENINGKLINDNSSDSGYEESQNTQDIAQMMVSHSFS